MNGVDANRVVTICHADDDICKGGDEIGIAHLDYSKDADTAAMFALGSVATLGITSHKMRVPGLG